MKPTISGVDCHAHVIDPARYPPVPGRGYQPRPDEVGLPADYWRELFGHGISHGVLVQPSCYAFDNRLLLETIAAAEGRCKGIAMVPTDVDERTLAALERAGIVGTRLNVAAFEREFFARADADAFVRRLAARGWLIQVYAAAADWERIAPVLAASSATVIVDHLGEPDVRRPLDDPGFQAVLALGRSGRAWLKLSAPYRVSRLAPPHDELAPWLRAARDAFGIERCIWGSDWPFLNARPTTYGAQRDWLERIVPDGAERTRVLVDNPRALYRFDAPG